MGRVIPDEEAAARASDAAAATAQASWETTRSIGTRTRNKLAQSAADVYLYKVEMARRAYEDAIAQANAARDRFRTECVVANDHGVSYGQMAERVGVARPVIVRLVGKHRNNA